MFGIRGSTGSSDNTVIYAGKSDDRVVGFNVGEPVGEGAELGNHLGR